MTRKSIPFLCGVILTLGLEALASSRSSFGKECSKAKKCDRKAWLSCYDGVCGCSRPEEMFFDEARGKCVTKSGERCKYGVEEDGEKSLVEITDCVTNSKCEEDGICTCDSRFHEAFNGTCEPSKSLNQSCSEEDKCSQFLQLHCINGVCNCKGGISVYSSFFSHCVGALNQNCIEGRCLIGAECRDGKCFCDINHYENMSTKTCAVRKRVHEECSNDSECIHKGVFMLKCIQGKCECDEGYTYSNVQKSQYTVHQAYRYDEYFNQFFQLSFTGPLVETCAPLVGKICPDGYCPPNSQCKVDRFQLQHIYERYRYNSESVSSDVLKNEVRVCECRSEFSTANIDNSACGKKWMDESKCKTNDDCVNNLACYESSCGCPSSAHQKVNSKGDYCFIKIGGPCSTSSDCVINSHCKLLPNATVGHCHCDDRFVENKDGECEGSHGTLCDYGGDIAVCDQAAGLVCVNKICSCKDNMMYTYSKTLRKCVGLVGARCLGKTSCGNNAECIAIFPGLELPGRCKCKPGFVENTSFTCEANVKQVELQF